MTNCLLDSDSVPGNPACLPASLNHSLSIRINLEDPQTLASVSDSPDTDRDDAFGEGRFLRLAARKCSKEVIAALLDRGLDINNTGDSTGIYSAAAQPAGNRGISGRSGSCRAPVGSGSANQENAAICGEVGT
jgi:hypothetical protein